MCRMCSVFNPQNVIVDYKVSIRKAVRICQTTNNHSTLTLTNNPTNHILLLIYLKKKLTSRTQTNMYT